MVKNSFIEKTYVVGTHWNCLIKHMLLKIREENYLEIYIFQVSCPLSLPLLIPNCKSVLNSCHSAANSLYFSKFEFMNYLFANLLVVWLCVLK